MLQLNFYIQSIFHALIIITMSVTETILHIIFNVCLSEYVQCTYSGIQINAEGFFAIQKRLLLDWLEL